MGGLCRIRGPSAGRGGRLGHCPLTKHRSGHAGHLQPGRGRGRSRLLPCGSHPHGPACELVPPLLLECAQRSFPELSMAMAVAVAVGARPPGVGSSPEAPGTSLSVTAG
ncbi:unnamed protein product [Pipistrellus nathusii]|uniref:Uncharacterized protein n=1 Tax=Pipistrellus nathusii TaxID=59473 RepID=A0ABN9ZPH7_PIPNA